MTKQQKIQEIKRIIAEDFKEAEYIGEDGAIAVDSKYSAEEAWKLISKRVLEDVGEFDFEEIYGKYSADDLIQWGVRLSTKEEKTMFDDTEIMIGPKLTNYNCYVWVLDI